MQAELIKLLETIQTVEDAATRQKLRKAALAVGQSRFESKIGDRDARRDVLKVRGFDITY